MSDAASKNWAKEFMENFKPCPESAIRFTPFKVGDEADWGNLTGQMRLPTG